jgi:hypothetical protein
MPGLSLWEQATQSLTRQQKAFIVYSTIAITLLFLGFDLGLLFVLSHGWHTFVSRVATGAAPNPPGTPAFDPR